jgi:hypothetical protein
MSAPAGRGQLTAEAVRHAGTPFVPPQVPQKV